MFPRVKKNVFNFINSNTFCICDGRSKGAFAVSSHSFVHNRIKLKIKWKNASALKLFGIVNHCRLLLRVGSVQTKSQKTYKLSDKVQWRIPFARTIGNLHSVLNDGNRRKSGKPICFLSFEGSYSAVVSFPPMHGEGRQKEQTKMNNRSLHR